MSKKCTPLWREAHFASQNVQNTSKHSSPGAFLEGEMSKKCKPLWCEAHFEVKSEKNPRGTGHFWTFRCRFAWQAQGIVHLVKSEQGGEVFAAVSATTTTTLHYITLHYITLHYITLHYTTPCYNYNYNSLRYPNYIRLH